MKEIFTKVPHMMYINHNFDGDSFTHKFWATDERGRPYNNGQALCETFNIKCDYKKSDACPNPECIYEAIQTLKKIINGKLSESAALLLIHHPNTLICETAKTMLKYGISRIVFRKFGKPVFKKNNWKDLIERSNNFL